MKEKAMKRLDLFMIWWEAENGAPLHGGFIGTNVTLTTIRPASW
jgi:hypothetical protein